VTGVAPVLRSQFGNISFEPDLSEQARDFASQPAGRRRFFPRNAAENVPYFIFQTAAIAPRSALQSSLDGILDVPDDQLGHNVLPVKR
jgi:hypothetical protein